MTINMWCAGCGAVAFTWRTIFQAIMCDRCEDKWIAKIYGPGWTAARRALLFDRLGHMCPFASRDGDELVCGCPGPWRPEEHEVVEN